jgi:hypothetical protein
LASANRTDQTDQAAIFGQNAGITAANAGKLTASLRIVNVIQFNR